jgi:hypothetical protein
MGVDSVNFQNDTAAPTFVIKSKNFDEPSIARRHAMQVAPKTRTSPVFPTNLVLLWTGKLGMEKLNLGI